ncbi:hypothetical protein [Emcibacter sp. SYSU 3D8]
MPASRRFRTGILRLIPDALGIQALASVARVTRSPFRRIVDREFWE